MKSLCALRYFTAGGDGTVATAARVLAGRGLPLAILPLGTANNIAKSLLPCGSFVMRWPASSHRRWTITLDGISTSGECLLVEVLNTPSIGPNLVLSQDANPCDGVFSVVIATERHRDRLDEYLVHRIAGGDDPLALTPRHARRIEILGWSDVHVDDQLLRTRSSETVSIAIEPAALEFLPGPCLAP